jgi:long-subunit acyl-CoA synthetase (AMP-forming)
VYGDSKEDKLVAVVVPDEEVLAARGMKITPKGQEAEVDSDQNLNRIILDELTSVGKAAGLKGFEQVYAGIFPLFHLL